MTSIRLRRAAWHVGAAVVVIAGGLVWRLVPLGLSPFWLKYGGSVLWGAMVLLLFGGGWGYRSGGTAYFQSPLGIILIVVLLVVLFGGFVGPRLGYYHY